MSESDIRNAERADTMSVSADDHDKWNIHALAFKYDTLPPRLVKYHTERSDDHPLGKGYYDEKIPEAYDVTNGQVLKKTVTYNTIECPECETKARKGERGLPVCPDCGIVCEHPEETKFQMVRDPKGANRVDANGNFIQ